MKSGKIKRRSGFRREIKYLSVKQPFAWLILEGIKDVENRAYEWTYRGELFIHASKDRRTLDDDIEKLERKHGIKIPHPWKLKSGGLLGSVVLADCVEESDSPWFEGPYGYILRDPMRIKPVALRGQPAKQKTNNVEIWYEGIPWYRDRPLKRLSRRVGARLRAKRD